MTITKPKCGKEKEEEGGEALNGNEDIYKVKKLIVANSLHGHQENTKKIEEEKQSDAVLCLPLQICTYKGGSGDDDNNEQLQLTSRMANITIAKVTTDGGDDDEEEEEEEEETKQRSESEEEEGEDDYLERGPMMGPGRLPRNRSHPYDPNAAVSPSSSSSCFDSESSNSSPDTSPRHSISITIPSRPHYGSVGLVTVVPPSEQNRGAEGESPSHDSQGRRRHSLKHLSGGGLVIPEDSSLACSPQPNPPNLPSPGQYTPILTVSSIQSEPLIVGQPHFVHDPSSLPIPSPYASYRDVPSHSPLSVQSFSDESLPRASPASDLGQPSPLGIDFQEYLSCSSSDMEIRSLPRPAIPNTPPFVTHNIDELVSSLVEEFGLPDKHTDFAGIKLYESADPVVASFASSSISSEHYTSSSDLHNFLPSFPVPPPPQQHRVQRSPTMVEPCNPRSRRHSKQDVKEEIDKIMKSFPKILPKLDTSSSSKQSSSSLSASNSSPPLLLTSGPPPLCNALTKMRSLFTDHARNVALVNAEKLTVEKLCSRDRDDGDTYLHIAICEGNFAFIYAIVTLLCEKKLSIDMKNTLGQTPLFVAVVVNNSTVVDYLLHCGAKPDCICRDGTTPLQVVAARGDAYYEVARLLCEAEHVNFGQRNSHGLTALHSAVQNHGRVSCLRIVQLFLQKGASLIEQESCNGKTALHLAVERGCIEMVRTLCENCSDVASALNAKTYMEDMPLHLAAMSRNVNEETHLELIEVLLHYGANPNSKNKDRKLPRDLVAANRSKVIQGLNLKDKMALNALRLMTSIVRENSKLQLCTRLERFMFPPYIY